MLKKNNTSISSNSKQFVLLFEADRNRLYAYIYAYVMNKAAADDIFQETSMMLWREFDNFELNTNFSKWANGIAFNRVRVYRRNNKNLVFGLSEELMHSISETISHDESVEQCWSALEHCQSLLREADHNLYENFYIKNMKAQEVADKTGRSIFAIRKSIHKLRKKLFDCVDKKSREELI